MNMRTIGPSLAVRTAAFILAGAIAAGCSGSARLLPAAPAADLAQDGRSVQTLVQIHIPRRAKRASIHPSTISPLTQSVAIAVNASKPHVFNATPSSPGCAGGSAGLTCTFALGAPSGTDVFTVTTYSGVNGTGTALDRGIAAKIPIAKGKANTVAVKLGPLVTNTANTGTGSLRYAVATAGAGDTIAFLLPKGSTITLSSPIILTGNLTIAGPGASLVAISGGNVSQIFQIAGTATIAGLTLNHARAAIASSPGGAIQNMGALTLASDVFGGNTSTVNVRRAPGKGGGFHVHGLHPHCSTTAHEGGAIYNDGALTITNTDFTGNAIKSDLVNCILGFGAAIYNDIEGTLSSTNDEYTGNAAAAGGAVYTVGIGAVTFTNDTFTNNTGCTASSGCPTSGCGTTSCTTFAAGQGAAIFDNGFGITVTGSTFTGNVAGGKTAGSQGQGGALYLESQLPTITKSTFTGNLAGGGTSSCSGGAGGAIFAVNALEIDSDVFKSNAAAGDGAGSGGAIAAAANVTGTGDNFTGNSAAASGGACTANSQGIGGAVLTGAVASFTSSTFSSNTATAGANADGGALGGPNILVTNCTFTSNATLATGSGGAAGAIAGGGALYGGTVVKISGSTFTSNGATAQSAVAQEAVGGAVAAGGTAISSNSAYTSNAVVMKNATGTAGGAGIAEVTGTLISSGDKFISNSVTSAGQAAGGAMFSVAGGFITNDTMTSNKVNGVQGAGGAMAFGGTGSMLKHVVATHNTATGTTLGAGGALLDGGGSQISDSQLSQNIASMMGGAVFSTSNPEVVVDSTIANNAVTAAKSPSNGGGGILAEGGLEMSQVTVSGNTVTIGGTGPAGGGGILAADILLIGSTVSGNKVIGTGSSPSGGGGILGGPIDAVNSTIGNNSSSVDGGGLESAETGNVLDNVTIFKNAATGTGGNLYNLPGATLTLTNSIVGGGTAGTGPDIDNAGTITSGDYNIVQTAVAGAALTGTTTHNLLADPKLLPLSSNGGPTFTNADTSTSPGRQHIPFSGASCGSISIAQDQRGFNRGSGGLCDSGAYEYAGVATAIARRSLPKLVARHRLAHNVSVALPHVEVIKLDFTPFER